MFTVTVSHLLGSLMWPDGEQLIPAMQHGMAIISYIKYWEWLGRKDDRVLARAQLLANYLCENALTPARQEFAYAGFPRSTGIGLDFPIVTSAQADVHFSMYAVRSRREIMFSGQVTACALD